jgi:hypothetical protein
MLHTCVVGVLVVVVTVVFWLARYRREKYDPGHFCLMAGLMIAVVYVLSAHDALQAFALAAASDIDGSPSWADTTLAEGRSLYLQIALYIYFAALVAVPYVRPPAMEAIGERP